MIMKVENLSFSYDNANIFKDINFSIDKGDVFCILGPNGTGKTTLLKSLNGILSPTKGNIIVKDHNLNNYSINERSKIIGYIPQGHVSTFPFSVFDVVLMGRAPYINLTGTPKENDLKIAENSLKKLGIYSIADREYTTLSGGEKQLVFLARILAQEPELLILDEPTSHLDFGNQIKLLNIINKLSKTGLSIIMSSHFPDHGFLTSNKVAIMKNKTFIDLGNPNEVITEENLKKAYNINIEIIKISKNRKVCIPI